VAQYTVNTGPNEKVQMQQLLDAGYTTVLSGGGPAEGNLTLKEHIEQGDRSEVPGAVRVSFGLYNTEEEVDWLLEGLRAIAAGAHRRDYVLNRSHGDYDLPDAVPDFGRYFQL